MVFVLGYLDGVYSCFHSSQLPLLMHGTICDVPTFFTISVSVHTAVVLWCRSLDLWTDSGRTTHGCSCGCSPTRSSYDFSWTTWSVEISVTTCLQCLTRTLHSIFLAWDWNHIICMQDSYTLVFHYLCLCCVVLCYVVLCWE